MRVLRLLLTDGTGRRHPADVAVVEDVPGGTLEERFTTEPRRAAAALDDLAGALDLMHRHSAPRYGRLDLLEAGGTAAGGVLRAAGAGPRAARPAGGGGP